MVLQTKKKLRKKDVMEDLSFLEAEAEVAAATGVTDHGSRGSRAGPAETAEAKRERETAIKEERCALLPLSHPCCCQMGACTNGCLQKEISTMFSFPTAAQDMAVLTV